MKSFVLVVLLVLGLSRSIFSSKYIEDTSEDQQDEDEGTKDTGDSEDQEEPDSDEYREDNNNQDNRDTGEEVVNIPGRPEEQEQTEDSEDDENGEYGEDEEENNNVQDERMMDNDEGRLPLPDEVEVYTPEQTGIEGFKRRVEELNKANENIQTTINEMKMKIDEALSSDSESNGPSDISVENKQAVPHDASNSYASVNEAREDSTDHLKQAGAQLEAHSDDDLARQYSEIGEDANTVPDEDY